VETYHIILQVLVLFLALSLLAETESVADKKTEKRGVLINVGSEGKSSSGSIGDSGGYRSVGERGSDTTSSNADHLGQG
jgi:hypothetical protein